VYALGSGILNTLSWDGLLMVRHFLAIGVFLLAAAAALRADVPAKLSVSWDNDAKGQPARIAVAGLNETALAACAKRQGDQADWAPAARVQVAADSPAETAQQPAISGRWFVDDKKLFFEPRFPFSAGTVYLVTIDGARLADPNAKDSKALTFEVRTPQKDMTPVTKLQHIYPTRKQLPENHLRFYIHFSQPMSRGEAYEHIKLLDAKGQSIADVFLELVEELWDLTMTRFTLLFHPGRVKRGLKLREELGPILETGKSYTLVVSGKWRDEEGRFLVDKEFRKEFTAGLPDDEPIDPKQWKLMPPSAATKDAFQVRFPKSLDHALLHRVVWIVNDRGQKVEGKITVAEDETLWKFSPAQGWQPGKYRLVADTVLEDTAGNRIGRAFEVDVFRPIPKSAETKTVDLEFEVK
jgi:hypothetical protein